MDILASIIGSPVRADVLAVLFEQGPRRWSPTELGRASHRPYQVVERHLKRLASAGVVRALSTDGKRQYEADIDAPVVRDLARFVKQTRGRVPRMRRALTTLRSPILAWIQGVSDLVVLTTAPTSLVRVQLAGVAGPDVEVHCLSVREWLARLHKGDVFVRRARSSRKLWVIGSWDELVRREHAQVEADRALASALANWREELSDEWDDDWDPFAPAAPDIRG